MRSNSPLHVLNRFRVYYCRSHQTGFGEVKIATSVKYQYWHEINNYNIMRVKDYRRMRVKSYNNIGETWNTNLTNFDFLWCDVLLTLLLVSNFKFTQWQWYYYWIFLLISNELAINQWCIIASYDYTI